MPDPPSAVPDPSVPTMADRLALVQHGRDLFVSRSPTDRRHVFGGLLLGQALRAAQLTVGGKAAHSLHASFVVAGAEDRHVNYTVERTRDGASFATRRVVAAQDHGTVLVLTADFHADEPGDEYAAAGPTNVPPPDSVPRGRYDTRWFESRDVPAGSVADAPEQARLSWFRPTVAVPDEPLLHLQALAYLTDHGATRAAREPHAHLADDAKRMSVSLDHAVWFHAPVDVNRWLLSEVHPVATGRGRGLALGQIRTAGGELVATFAQEVLLRSR